MHDKCLGNVGELAQRRRHWEEGFLKIGQGRNGEKKNREDELVEIGRAEYVV